MKNIYKYTKYIVPAFIILSIIAYFMAYKYLSPDAYIKVNGTKFNISSYSQRPPMRDGDYILVNDYTYSDRYMLKDAVLHIDGTDFPIEMRDGIRDEPTYSLSHGLSKKEFSYSESSIYNVDPQMLKRIQSAKDVSMTFQYSDGVNITKKVDK